MVMGQAEKSGDENCYNPTSITHKDTTEASGAESQPECSGNMSFILAGLTSQSCPQYKDAPSAGHPHVATGSPLL